MGLDHGIDVSLREVSEDLADVFAHQLDLTHAARLHKGLSAPTVRTRTIVADGHIVRYIAHFRRNDQPEVSYWIGRQ